LRIISPRPLLFRLALASGESVHEVLVIFIELMERTQSMDASLYDEIELLPGMTVEQLQRRYEEIFGEPTGTKHKVHLIRRIAWRLQVLAQGDLPQRARQRALAMASDADLRTQVPAEWVRTKRAAFSRHGAPRDCRLPVIGTILRRSYRGKTVEVQVLQNGFEYQGRHYGSLSAIAREATGTRWNGLLFFGLTTRAKGTKRAAH